MPASAPGRGALELRGVTKRYGTGQGGQITAADAVTFTIEAGAFAALTGASGARHPGREGRRLSVGVIALLP